MLLVKSTIFLGGLLLSLFVDGQNLDSLKNNARLHPNDTVGIVSATELCYQYRFVNQDSALYYGELAKENAKRINFLSGLAQACSDLGVIYYDKGQFRNAMQNWTTSLELRVKQHDSLRMASLHLKIGSLLFKQGKYDESLVHQLTSLEIYRKKKFEGGMSYALNNIAAVYEHQSQLDKALEYYRQSYSIKEKTKDNYQLGLTQINIANIYFQKKEYDVAKAELKSAIARLHGLSQGLDYLAIAYNNLSDVYSSTNRYDSALLMTRKALDLRRSIHDYQGIVSSLNNLGSILTHLGRYDEARFSLTTALDSANFRKLLPEKEKIYLNLYQLYSLKAQSPEALKYYVLYSQAKDSLLNENSQKNINELRVNYESEQKERELATNQLELQKTRLRVYLLAAVAMLLLISAGWILQSQRSRRKKSEVQLQLAQARLENELQQVRLRISRELHDNIGSRLLFLTSAAESMTDNPKAEEVTTFARNTLHELRRTVWLINRDSVTAEELEMKLREYFTFMNNTGGPAITVTLSGDTGQVIRSPKAAAIFRVAQEAVSNAIKYSSSQSIDVGLQIKTNIIELIIADEGRGFNTAGRHSGNGLKNMDAHIKGVKGNLAISSDEKGTAVEAKIPLD